MSDDDDRNEGRLDRREFLRKSAVATLGVGSLSFAGAGATAAEPAPPAIGSRRKLGKTGLEISDISFGSGTTKDPDLVRYAFDRGIRYFDTAESYPLADGGKAEIAIGQALLGKRNEVVLATKVIAAASDRRGKLMHKLEASLGRLQTDHVDIYFNHAVNDVERLLNPEWFEFVELAKKQGKIRFSGMSGHGGHLIECLDIALDRGLVDVILAAHNFGQDPAFYERFTKSFDIVANQVDLPRVLEKAHQKGVGVVVMKTLMGARLNDMRPYEKDGATFAQAAFRWVLSNPNVDGLIVTMKSRKMIDEYVAASGTGGVRRSDLRLLERYIAANAATHCSHGCRSCEDRCPAGVPISEVLRTRMYATDYADPELARAEYRQLGAGASACSNCSEQRCLGACPAGIDIPRLTRFTAETLGSEST